MSEYASAIPVRSNTIPLSKMQEAYGIVESILDNLDGKAAAELYSANEGDIDKILDILLDETLQVICAGDKTINTYQFDYLEKFTESVEDTLRCRSFNYFKLSCLPDFIMGWHNIEWGNLVQIYRLLCILAARDHGKSYEFSFAYILWQLFRYRPKGALGLGVRVPMELQMAREGMLITNEYGLATHLLSLVKSEIESNPILNRALMPESKKEGWGAEKIVTKNGSSIVVKSANSKIRGHHPTWAVMDDFLNESSLYSQDQREKYLNIFTAVILPALSPGGQLIAVGTPFFETDLYHSIKKTGQFGVFEYPAIMPDGTLLFPQRHTFESLMQKKHILGSLVFSREILVKPISDAASIFPYPTLRNAIRGQDSVDVIDNMDSSSRKFVKIVVGCDFAISSSVGADYSVFTILGVDELGNFHVLNCWRKSGANYAQQVAALKKINMDFRPDIIYCEDNGMQQIFVDLLKDANLPVMGKTTNATNKKSLYQGIPSLAVLFETSRIKFPYGTQRAKNLTDLYFGELNSITYIQNTGKLESISQHDDTGMSLWIAIRAARGNLGDFDFSFA